MNRRLHRIGRKLTLVCETVPECRPLKYLGCVIQKAKPVPGRARSKHPILRAGKAILKLPREPFSIPAPTSCRKYGGSGVAVR